MDTAVALVSAYLHFNGYITVPEQPVLVGHGVPWRYHTATDVDVLAVRFPSAAVVVPRHGGGPPRTDDDLVLESDPELGLAEDAVDVIVGEVKEGKPRLNDALRDRNVLYATLRRVDAGFEESIDRCVDRLAEHGETTCKAGGRRWRLRLVAFGDGGAEPGDDDRPFTVVQLRHVAQFLMRRMAEHRKVWRDAQFSDPVLNLLHLLDKLSLVTIAPKEET